MRRGSNKIGRGWTAKGGKIRKDQDGTKACSDRRQLKHRKQAKGTGDAMIVGCRFVSQPGVGGESIEIVHSRECALRAPSRTVMIDVRID